MISFCFYSSQTFLGIVIVKHLVFNSDRKLHKDFQRFEKRLLKENLLLKTHRVTDANAIEAR